MTLKKMFIVVFFDMVYVHELSLSLSLSGERGLHENKILHVEG